MLDQRFRAGCQHFRRTGAWSIAWHGPCTSFRRSAAAAVGSARRSAAASDAGPPQVARFAWTSEFRLLPGRFRSGRLSGLPDFLSEASCQPGPKSPLAWRRSSGAAYLALSVPRLDKGRSDLSSRKPDEPPPDECRTISPGRGGHDLGCGHLPRAPPRPHQPSCRPRPTSREGPCLGDNLGEACPGPWMASASTTDPSHQVEGWSANLATHEACRFSLPGVLLALANGTAGRSKVRGSPAPLDPECMGPFLTGLARDQFALA